MKQLRFVVITITLVCVAFFLATTLGPESAEAHHKCGHKGVVCEEPPTEEPPTEEPEPTPPPPPPDGDVLEGEAMTLVAGQGQNVSDAGASGSQAKLIWSNDSARGSKTPSAEVNQVTVTARGEARGSCASEGKKAHGDVYINGSLVGSFDATSGSTYADFPFAMTAASSSVSIDVRFTNDSLTSTCDNNLYVDKITLGTGDGSGTTPPPPPPSGTNPFDKPVFLPTAAEGNYAQRTVDKWKAEGRTADAEQMRKIAETGQVQWLTRERTDMESFVASVISRAEARGQLPVLAQYYIPKRDCGHYAGGGAPDSDSYLRFTDRVVAGIGSKKAVIILETDAIAQSLCSALTDAERTERYRLISEAIKKLKTNPNTYVYIDGGHEAWQTAERQADMMTKAGVANADGFFTNIANYYYTANEVAYGKRLSALVGGKPFVVDTSRNGNGPYTGGTHSGGCPPYLNPPGRAIGERSVYHKPTDPLVHAYLWAALPGLSDGGCGTMPPLGTFMEEYALEMAKQAKWSL
jgi:endoglucanase